MKKHVFVFIFIVMGLVMIFHPCCNNGTNGGGQYLLNVVLSAGVTGNPPAGTHSYDANSTVTYLYSLQSGYQNLQVILDGMNVTPSGLISIGTSDHILNVTATASSWDVRGNWNGTLTDANNPDPFNVTFSGTSATSGTTSGGIGGPIGTGTFTVSGTNINFTLVWGFGNFTLTGTLSSSNSMSGTWVWQPGGSTGTWQLSRI